MEWLLHPFSDGSGIYFGLILCLIICGIGLPIPEEATFLAAGFLGRKMGADPWLLCAAGMSGVLVGDLIPFFVGRHLSATLFKTKFALRWFPPEKRARFEAFVKKRGTNAVFIARFLGGLRTPSFMAAGAMGMPLGVFVLWDSLGAIISCPTSIWLAYLYGEKAYQMMENGEKLVLIGIAVLLVIALIKIRHKRINGLPDAEEPADPTAESIVTNGWFWRTSYAWIHSFTTLLLRIMFRYEVIGAEKIPLTGPVVLAANHASFIDPIFLAGSTRRRVYFLMYSTFYHSIAKPIFQFFRTIPVDEKKFIQALKAGINVLKLGECVGVFPEGAVSHDGKLLPAHGGAVLMAQRAKAPLIPVLIKGNYDVLPRGAWFPRFKKVKILVGEPIIVDEKLPRAEAMAIMDNVMRGFASELNQLTAKPSPVPGKALSN